MLTEKTPKIPLSFDARFSSIALKLAVREAIDKIVCFQFLGLLLGWTSKKWHFWIAYHSVNFKDIELVLVPKEREMDKVFSVTNPIWKGV